MKHGVWPINQGQRKYYPDLLPQITVEMGKLINAGFIQEVPCPTWISNIVLVKKNGQICVCVDFHVLNNVCPKDDFLATHD